MKPRPELRPDLEAAAAAIAGASSLVVTCHLGPDGDALGSAIALALAARDAGKPAVATFGDPFIVPDHFAFLDASVLAPVREAPPEPEVLVSLDSGSLDRLGEVQELAGAAGCVVVIDHHASNTGFGDVNLIDPTAGATAQLCYYLLMELGWRITAPIATALHVGVVTDTGRFQYSNTSPELLRVGAELVAAGAQPEVIGQHVYESVPFGYLRVAGLVLGRAVLEPERHFVWSVLRIQDLVEHSIGIEDTDPLIDAVRVAKEADVAALAKEQAGGGTKVSLRSRGRVDVAAIAAAMGGGGHHNAAGFTYAGEPEAAIAEVRARL